jgi:NodT family efflux transporter outer membrane factor (OMF) lipoprotein
MRLRTAPVTAAMALLAGCAAAPDKMPTASDVALPSEFTFAPEQQGEAQAEVAGLLPDEDPAFRALSSAALEDAPVLAEALARVEAARASARRAGAERLPSVDAGVSVERARSNPAQFGDAGSFIDSTRTTYGANVTASWDLDVFGRLRASERAARAQLDAAGGDAAAVRLALISEIAAAVIDWRTLSARRASLESDVQAAEDIARLAADREESGIAPGFDRIRAEVQASASRSQLAALESERANLIGRLVTLTARPAGEVVEVLDTPAETAPALGSPPPAVPSVLLANRPDVQAAEARLRAADAQLAATAAQRFPRLTLSGALGLLAFDFDALFDDDDSQVYNFGGSLAGPLLDFGRIGAEIDRSEAETLGAFASYRGAVFTALGDAEAAYLGVQAADRQAIATAREAEQAARAARLSDVRFRAGLSDFLTVLEARRSADGSGARAAVASGQARRARVLLWQALGGAPLD